MASRITMPAAEFELGDSIQSSHSYSVALIADAHRAAHQRPRLRVKKRTVWWSDCENPSAATMVFFSTRLRASTSFG